MIIVLCMEGDKLCELSFSKLDLQLQQRLCEACWTNLINKDDLNESNAPEILQLINGTITFTKLLNNPIVLKDILNMLNTLVEQEFWNYSITESRQQCYTDIALINLIIEPKSKLYQYGAYYWFSYYEVICILNSTTSKGTVTHYYFGKYINEYLAAIINAEKNNTSIYWNNYLHFCDADKMIGYVLIIKKDLAKNIKSLALQYLWQELLDYCNGLKKIMPNSISNSQFEIKKIYLNSVSYGLCNLKNQFETPIFLLVTNNKIDCIIFMYNHQSYMSNASNINDETISNVISYIFYYYQELFKKGIECYQDFQNCISAYNQFQLEEQKVNTNQKANSQSFITINEKHDELSISR